MIAMRTPTTAAEPGARPVEVLVVRLLEGNRPYRFGLLISQIGALLRQPAVPTRPVAQPDPERAVGEAQYENRWLPIYDLAGILRLLAPRKLDLSSGQRAYLLVIRGRDGHQALLSVDDVTEIGVCRLDRIHPLPGWLRRQLHPPLVWAGIQSNDLAMVQSTTDVSADPAVGTAAGLLLLIDCAPLMGDRR